MRKLLILPLISVMVIGCGNSYEKADHLVLIEGGAYVNKKANDYKTSEIISDFYMGKYEVTQQEWVSVMGNNPSRFLGDHLPVEMVNWYDCIEYCNKRSVKEGLEPYYNIDKDKADPENKCDYDNIKWIVTINAEANGYRLPTEAEWEYAASGGKMSKDYTYSGSNDVDQIAWYWRNAGNEYLKGDWSWPVIESNHNTTKPIGKKEANELGLYDMSGNVREWCWDWYQDSEHDSGFYRVWKGGGIIGDARGCEFSYRGKFEANGMGYDQGLRVCRTK